MMGATDFELFVSHCQLTVFDASFRAPFNDWTQRHFDQGFAWRSSCVAFRTVETDGPHLVVVDVGERSEPPTPYAERIIDVPFEVTEEGAIIVASVAENRTIEVCPGRYQMRFECAGRIGSDPKARFLLVRADHPGFRIVRADALLKPSHDLLLTASPA